MEALVKSLVLLLALRLVAAASCPGLELHTVEADCFYVIGRSVPCEKPSPTGTQAHFRCKPLYRVPTDPLQGGQTALLSSTCTENGVWSPPPVTCVPDCGRAVGKGETLIADGTPVQSSADFPWHAAIYEKQTFAQICGGSLISLRFIVSAAHCFYHPKNGRIIRPASDFSVGVGKIMRFWNATEEFAQHRDVFALHVHGYGGQRLNHVKDFALVELVAEVELNAHTLPVCVDWAQSLPPLSEDDVGTVLGWGNLWNEEPQARLQSASLPFVSTESCLKMIPAQLVQYVLLPNDRFCAGQMNGSVVAHGDSGGGIAFQSAHRKWYVHGVVSVGIPNLRTLTTFTNVSSFVKWMATVIQDEEILSKTVSKQVTLEVPLEYTASLLEEEQRVAYFREDLGANLFHYHWHYTHPYSNEASVKEVDRRGELFYYTHQQIVARYNAERLSNGLSRVKRFQDLREPIREGYYPKLDNIISSRVWPGRPPFTALSDVNRDNIRIQIDDISRWRDRLQEAIDKGFVITPAGDHVNLTTSKGIDILGHLIESSVGSVNPGFYGEFVNQGHVALAMAHDPDNRYLEPYGVMGEVGTALRDPVYYRLHASAGAMFQRHKSKLPGYTEYQLLYPHVAVVGLSVVTPGHARHNELLTLRRKIDLALSRGMDFAPRLPVVVRVTHLDHRPFFYRIKVDNQNQRSVKANVRLFIAPMYDEKGSLLPYEEQRLLMLQLDRFSATLTPGANVLERNSSQSSVTIPFERTFRNLDVDRPEGGRELDDFHFCGCGWPHHLLIPRGAPLGKGSLFQLFVMVSDHELEKVELKEAPLACSDAPAYCGLRGSRGSLRYPDVRPMGFPFDRRSSRHVDTLRAFLYPNMFAQAVTIRHLDIVEVPRKNATILPEMMMKAPELTRVAVTPRPDIWIS